MNQCLSNCKCIYVFIFAFNLSINPSPFASNLLEKIFLNSYFLERTRSANVFILRIQGTFHLKEQRGGEERGRGRGTAVNRRLFLFAKYGYLK